MDDALRTTIDAGDLPRAHQLLLAAAAKARAAVGLGTTSPLSALQLAALHDAEAAERMLAQGTACDLHSACALGRTEDIAGLATSASCNMLAEHLPPIGFAILRGQLPAVQALLAAGDDPNRSLPRIGFFLWEIEALTAGHAGWRPLHAAATHGYAENAAAIIATLTAAGADVEAICVLGERPLHLAATYGWLSVLEALFAAGAKVNAPTGPIPPKVWNLASPPGVLPVSGQTPLMVAAREGQRTAVAVLLKHGAGLNARDSLGGTALHAAARPWWREEAGLAGELLAAGADRRAKDNDGNTPADLAAAAGYTKTAAALS